MGIPNDTSAKDLDAYRTVIKLAVKNMLFFIDRLFLGNGEKSVLLPYRLAPSQYREARSAIATLYRIAMAPEFEANTTFDEVSAARSDKGFQSFMDSIETKTDLH